MTRIVVSGLCTLVILGCLTLPAIAEVDEAREVWDEYCTSCHGPAGKGDGPAAVALNDKPADLTDCKKIAAESDERLRKVIAEGGKAVGLSGEMAAWSHRLDPEEIEMLVQLIRGFCCK